MCPHCPHPRHRRAPRAVRWFSRSASSCAHPVDDGNQIAQHPGTPVRDDTLATMVITEAGGAATMTMCPGKSYAIQARRGEALERGSRLGIVLSPPFSCAGLPNHAPLLPPPSVCPTADPIA